VLPDAQNATLNYPQVLASQTAWVAQNQAALNIQAFLGLGDLVSDGASDVQDGNADAAIRTLDNAGIPYFLAIGNHDYDGALPRNATGFNRWFGPARYVNYSYYKGNYPTGSNENSYGVLTINGTQYLFLVLEFVPRDAALQWAASILDANQDKPVIVVTHSHMYTDNTRADRCDTRDMVYDNNGDDTWTKLFSQYSNILMVLSGHMTNGNGSRRADLGVSGNLVNQLFSNYQELANGGNGWLRIMKFHPSQNTVDVLTYSPFLDSYMTDGSNQFTIYYNNPQLGGNSGTVSGLVRDVNTCARIPGATLSVQGSTTTSDSNGHYSFTLSAPGSVSVQAVSTGWAPLTRTAPVNAGYASDLNFYLNQPLPSSCTLSTTDRTVTMCGPSNNANVTSPVTVTAGATDSKPVTEIQIYVDGVGGYHVPSNMINTSVAMAPGNRRLTVQATDALGTFKQTVYVNVANALPGVTVKPSSLQFGSIKVGSNSAAQTITLSSTSTLTIASITASGDFTQSNNCGSGLSAGGSCTINVVFSPTVAGARSGSVTINDSDSSSPQTVALSGTGTSGVGCTPGTVNPSVTICAPLNNASVSSPVHASASTTDSNKVTQLQIFVDGVAVYTVNASTLEADVPLKPGTHRLTVQAKDSTGLLFKQSISVTSVSSGVTVTPSSLNFGSIVVGSSGAAQSVTLSSTNALTINSIVASGDFTQSNNCGSSLSAGGSCTINVTFSPTVTGARSGSVTINDSDSSSPQTVALSGTGTSGVGCTPGTVNPSVTICAPLNNASVSSPVHVSASTTDSNKVTQLQIFVDGVAVYTVNASTLEADVPLKPGTHRLTVQAKDSTGLLFKQSVTVSGVSSGVTVTPSSLSFGSIVVGSSSSAQPVTLSSTNALTITSITVSGDFTQSNNCGSSLAAGGSCTISVQFTPTVLGARSGTLSFNDSDSSSPQTVALSGTGTSGVGCTPGTVNPSVTICAPVNNASVTSPVHVSASTTDSNTVTLLQIYIDGSAVYTTKTKSLEADITLATGTHRLTVQAKDSAGITFKQSISINVQ
jgi:hypothetical protein